MSLYDRTNSYLTEKSIAGSEESPHMTYTYASFWNCALLLIWKHLTIRLINQSLYPQNALQWKISISRLFRGIFLSFPFGHVYEIKKGRNHDNESKKKKKINYIFPREEGDFFFFFCLGRTVVEKESAEISKSHEGKLVVWLVCFTHSCPRTTEACRYLGLPSWSGWAAYPSVSHSRLFLPFTTYGNI